MPLRLSTPDNGFTAHIAQQTTVPAPTGQPLTGIADTLTDLALFPTAPAVVAARHPQAFDSAMRLDNAVFNGWQALTRPTFTADPTFDPLPQLQASGLWDQYRDNFVNVRSQGEYDWTVNKIAQENNDRQTLARAGSAGVLLGMQAGLVDPTSLLPAIAEGKGVIALMKSVLLGTAAAAIDEVPLRFNQLTRTNADTAFSVAGGAVMGGFLGGASQYLRGAIDRAGTADALARVANDIDVSPNEAAISNSRVSAVEDQIRAVQERQAAERSMAPLDDHELFAQHKTELDDLTTQLHDAQREAQVPVREIDDALRASSGKGASVGAEALDRDAGGLKGMLGIGERLTKIAGPVTANLGQRVSRTIRQATAELSTAGLRLERNLLLSAHVIDPATGKVIQQGGEIIGSIPSNQGGTVESIVQSRRAEVLGTLNKSYENYSNYVFGKGQAEGPFRNQRAAIAGAIDRRAKVGPNSRMNRKEFFQAVGNAMLQGDKHAIPEVAATAAEHRKLYDSLFDEAKQVGIISPEVELIGDPSFLNRLYDQDAIARNPNRFLELLTEHMNEQLQKDFQKTVEGFKQAQARDTQRVSDMTMPAETAKPLREALQAELKALDATANEDLGPMEELITGYRSAAATAAKDANKLTRQIEAGAYGSSQERQALVTQRDRLLQNRNDYRDEVANLQQLGGADLQERAARRAEIKRRLRGLNKNEYYIGEQYRKKFSQIEVLEEDSLSSADRLVGAGQRALAMMNAVSDKSEKAIQQAGAALDSLVAKWTGLGNKIEALKAKPENTDVSIENPDNEVAKLLGYQNSQATTLQRLLDAQESLRSLSNIDRTEGGVQEARAAIQEALDATTEQVVKLNAKRAQRIAKLEASAEKFDKEAWNVRVKEVQDRIKTREAETRERLRAHGAENVDLEGGTADFKQHAQDIAESAMERIQGTNVRLPGFDALSDARGTELARTLSIPSERLTPYGFLNTDAEHLIHAYGNTLIPDIELTRRLGTLAPDGSLNPTFKSINEEERQVLARVEQDIRFPLQKDGTRKGVALSAKQEAALGQQLKDVRKEFDTGRKNLQAIIMRLRHQWGVPKSPNGYMARGVSVVQSLQALRLLGGVTLSSISDLGRPIMKYGLLRTGQSAWVPLVTNLKAVRMSMREAQRAFVAIETLTADRAHQMADLLQNAQRRSKGEAVLEWGTSKLNIIAGFGPWTDVMKTLSTMTFTSKVLDSLELALRGKGNAADRKEATEFLASLGWDSQLQERVWKQIEDGGGEQIGGTWVPQTERWADKEAVRAMRAATYSEAAASIVTPGVEKNLFLDSTATGKIIFSLKSFSMSSTSKTTMAALQQRDMAVLNGTMISLALGLLSVYLKAQVAGGTSLDRFNSLSPQQMVNEAIDASGMMGAISLGTQLASDLSAGPASGDQPQQKLLHDVRGLVGAYDLTDPANQLIGDAFGPSVSLVQLVAQAEASGHWTPSEIHRIRQLLPFQNLVYMRWLFDKLENAVGGSR